MSELVGAMFTAAFPLPGPVILSAVRTDQSYSGRVACCPYDMRSSGTRSVGLVSCLLITLRLSGLVTGHGRITKGG